VDAYEEAAIADALLEAGYEDDEPDDAHDREEEVAPR
jgi:hypothetical protein